ncbi:alpha/beta fold hydrolase [Rhodopila sp.]|jgi:pimeloyl-ACP methyl ester carboxylesterase|uniref:alpha/beta fold hydrolase n=1 Tax=Rhodopila sp. TaxID=2480087 RepID=UPI002D0138B0|nr:alpha/beta hydrolase [Rhodopila sp.]HVZ08209.1 alpha/beta hydrolase [Rhodopila sp.]
MPFPITEHVVRTSRHTTFYLACGRPDATPLIFLHGWPELSISWRHQLPVFAALGFYCLAPDMRGYGRSSLYTTHRDYAVEHMVRDMLELLEEAVPHDKAIWIGHDWGSPVAWSIASHHPAHCLGVANLCVPYIPDGFAVESLLPLVDRDIYPEDQFPAGQWEYQLFYRENFDAARSAFEANVDATVKALFRKGNAAAKGQPSRTALVRRDGGWFGGAGVAPDVPADTDVLSEADLCAYVASLKRNGFFGPDSWYMNGEWNRAYASQAANGGRLDMPVLFLHGAFDYTCETVESRLAEPMRAACSDLTEVVVRSGHWMAQERPLEVNAALAKWLAVKLPGAW